MPFNIFGANSVSGYTVKNSLRFNSGSSDVLTRTPASTSGNQIFTVSMWVKRANLGGSTIFYAYQDGNNADAIGFNGTDNSFQVAFYDGGAYTVNLITTQLFRDVSAWYHFVVAIDTTQATNTNRAKLYVNGTQVTAFSTATYPSQNATVTFNKNVFHVLGAGYYGSYSDYCNIYLSEVNWITGQQLTPSSFGETDTLTGIWKPKAYTGTYGTNGFYLKFANSASLGTDSSGNGNNFTVNNLTSVDQTTDTPTNNFCTLNGLFPSSTTLTEGNLALSGTSKSANGTFGFTSGKWYFETKVTAVGGNAYIGIVDDTWLKTDSSWSLSQIWVYVSDGNKYGNGSSTSYGATYTTGDIIGTAVDMDNGTITFYKNGTSQGTAFNTGISGKLMFPWIYAGTSSYNINFGNPSYTSNGYTDGAGYGNFSYSVPSGYYSLCTKNLANFG